MSLLSSLFSRFQREEPKAPATPEAPARPKVIIRRERSMSESEKTPHVRGVSRSPITRDHRRDLMPLQQERMRAIARYLWRQNPVAKRGIQNLRSFVTSEGFKVRALAKDPAVREKVQAWLDKWWTRNRWDELLSKRVETLCVEGEWFYWEAPPDDEGISRLCLILPENVRDVERDPLDAERLWRVKLSEPLEFEVGGCRRIKHHLEIVDECCQDGEVFVLQINTLSGQTRGFSDLLVVSDWLDYLDTLTFTEIERIQFQRNFSWFVKLDSDDQDQILDKRNELNEEGPPNAGSVKVIGKGEEWEAKSPNLNLSDSAEFIKLIKLICFGGLIMPEHYFSSGGDVNKATSANMDTPVFAFTRDRKALVRSFLSTAIRKGLRVARRMGIFGSTPLSELGFEVVSRDPDRSAYDLIGDMLSKLGQALQLGEAQGYVSKEDAARAYRMAASGLGLGDFPGVDNQALSDVKATVDARLEAYKSQLQQEFPTRTPSDVQGSRIGESEEGEKKKIDDLTSIVAAQSRETVQNASSSRAYVERMASEVAVELLKGQSADAPIMASHVEDVLRRFRPKFREDFPTANVLGAVDSGREFVRRSLEGKGLNIPSGSVMTPGKNNTQVERSLYWRVLNVTVAEPPEGVNRSIGGRRRSLGREVQYSLAYWAGERFENSILERMKTAREQGIPLDKFARSLSDGKLSEIVSRRVMADIAYAEHRAQKFAEELMYQDIDAANPGRLKIRFTRIGANYCKHCSPLSGDTFAVSDAAERSRHRTPQHSGCRCTWVPVVAGEKTSSSFFQDLAKSVEEASEPLRAVYRTAPDLAEYVQRAKDAGIETVADVSRVGRRALEDVHEHLTKQPDMDTKERLARAGEQAFKNAEDDLKAVRADYVSGRVTRSVLSAAQENFSKAQELWAEERREIARVRRNAVLQTLRDAGVELGGEPFRWHEMTSQEIKRTFSRVAGYIPKSWADSLNRAPMVGLKGSDESKSGYYPPTKPSKPGRMIVGGSSRDILDGSALHELMHAVELGNVGLRKLATDFLKRRVEVGRAFEDPYFGRTYSNGGTEIFSSGLESVYFSTRRTWTKDEELLEFLIGAMLTVI